MIARTIYQDTFSLEDVQSLQDWANENLIIDGPVDDNILFQANFANTTLDISNSSGHQIFNGDTIDGTYYEFPYDLPGLAEPLGIGSDNANYFNYIFTTADPTNPSSYENYVKTEFHTGLDIPGTTTTTALYQEYITNDGTVTRNQYTNHGKEGGDIYDTFNQMYLKQKKFIHKSAVNQDTGWSLPFEWKQYGDYGRMGLYIYGFNAAETAGDAYWYLKSENHITALEWYSESAYAGSVPLDEWFDIEVFFIASSDPSVGRFQMAITRYIDGVAQTPEVLFNAQLKNKEVGYEDVMYYSSHGNKVYGTDAYMLTTDIIMAKEPIAGSPLGGSGA